MQRGDHYIYFLQQYHRTESKKMSEWCPLLKMNLELPPTGKQDFPSRATWSFFMAPFLKNIFSKRRRRRRRKELQGVVVLAPGDPLLPLFGCNDRSIL
jgi:hypothetical protein